MTYDVLGMPNLDDAGHDDRILRVRLLQSQQVGDVAVRIDLFRTAAGRVDGPREDPLATVATRGEPERLCRVLTGSW